ncbi:MAG: carbamoyltransferase HypF [Verrucomicrobia bacterium]|nr:carbamoyltransferase HypF [Verrucomicrobiota bacterium]
MIDSHRHTYDIQGTIQGVGFRPALYRLATQLHLGGSVQNRTNTVHLVLEGPSETVDQFMQQLPDALPPHAVIDELKAISREPLDRELTRFEIITSDESGEKQVQIPADLAICPDCRDEIFDATAHRYRYPFTTCTNCGPRYTVVNSMPYDRERTTLERFPLCPLCEKEYTDPTDRRFHAETIACPDCGPRIWLEASGTTPCPSPNMRGEGTPPPVLCALEAGCPHPTAPLIAARALLADGQIVAVRGLGGFLLATDAMNRRSLQRLRARKARPEKPFAVMAPSLDVIRRYCRVSDAEEGMLTSPEAPIVILDVHAKHYGPDAPLPLDLLSPDTQTLGVMLPTSPLHALLAEPTGDDPTPSFDLLIMTSGNRRGEPIAITNDEAHSRMRDIADAFLCHDREINLRCDDSLCIEQLSGPQVWRRARGYAPRALPLPRPLDQTVLAMGAELKNAIALGYDSQLVLSPHIGDLETPEALNGMEEAVTLFPEFLQRTPEMIAVDLHPDMHATRLGRRLATERGLPLQTVQHHYAHGLACLGEHGLTEGLALVFDGTGYGTDGTIWGAELLDIRPDGFTRLATFAPVPLPGGDQAVRHPMRQLLGRWVAAGVPLTPDLQERLGATDETLAAWALQATRGLNAPSSHAAGRLFDAFAAAIGLSPHEVTYEGQAAIRLEAIAARHTGAMPHALPFDARETEGRLEIDWAPLFIASARPQRSDSPLPATAMAFHRSLALAAGRMVDYGFSVSEKRTVALSGGVFMNRILNVQVTEVLAAMGANVLVHQEIPPNDGGIAAGQVMACAGGDCKSCV